MSSPPPKHSLSSPTSGNTPHPVLPTPSSSTSVSIRQNNKTSQLRQELEQQLVEKQKQLQESSSGIGKNVLARQVSQLQDRIKEIDSITTNNNNTTHDEVHPISVDRLRSLERDLTSYRTHPLSPGISSIRNKEKLLNQRSTSGLDPLPSPSTSTLLPPTHGHDSTSLLPLPPPPTGSTPTKRRSKIPNTDRRNTDIEFATEIGQGLLLEVRKMQALLQEKEEKLRTLENQKADLERAAEAMAKQMRQREENEEKLKEETWNLELAKQELTISVTELQQNLSKANVEQNKLAKQVNTLRSEIEKLRDKEEKLTNTIDNMKQRHEQDMSSIRRHTAAIQREKSDQSKQIEALTSELAIAKAQSRIGKHVSTDTEVNTRSGDTTDDQITSILASKNDTSPTSTNSPPSSPKQLPTRNQAMEVETLKTSLAHAHRMVSNLRSNLHKEKTEKFEFKKLLAESQETIEQLQNDPRMWVDAGPTRGASGSSSNMATREDGLLPGRKSHKASISSKRRTGRKTTSGRNKLKTSQHTTADDGDSVYSYSSMSEIDDSEDVEDVDSFDDSDDIGFDSNISKKKTVAFTPLSSELSRSQSQSQLQKPVMVDAEVNTDPIDDFMLPPPILDNSTTGPVTRSLGDELGMAMLQKSPEESSPVTSLKNITGAGATIAVDALTKHAGVEMITQTDSYDLEQASILPMSVEPTKPVELELVSQSAMSVEPEDPSISLAANAAAIAAAIAASRSKSLEEAVDSSVQYDSAIALADKDAIIAAARAEALEAAVDSSVQSDPIDPSIALAETAAAIAAARAEALEAAVDSSVQSDPIDPSIALAETAAAIAAARSKALEAAVDSSVQSDPIDPSIALAETAAAIAAARAEALEAAVDSSVQSDPIDPSIALAETAAAIATARSKALEAAVDSSVQSDPIDPSIALAETAAAIAAARSKALGAAVDSATQSEEPVEDPSIALAALAATAAATAAAIAASRSKAIEEAVDCSTQSEPIDPSIALAEKSAIIAAARAEALEAAIHCYTQSDEPEVEDPAIALAATAAAIAAARAKALESAIDCSTQSEEPEKEDPSIAIAAAEAASLATAAAVAAGIAASRSAALESAINTSTQSDEPEVEDPSIALAKTASAAAALRTAALEAAIHTSTQCDPEDPSILAAAIASAVASSRSASLESAIDHSTQVEEDPSIAIAAAEAAAAATAAAIAASRLASLEAGIDTFTQSEGASVVDQETQSEETKVVDSGVQSTPVDAVDAFIQSECGETKDAVVQYEDPAGPVPVSVDHETQYDIFGIDHSTQSEFAETTECGVQSDPPFITDASVQHEVESTDIGVQCEEESKHDIAAAIIPIPPVSSRTFSDSEDEFFDANSKPSSGRTFDSSIFNNVKPVSFNSHLEDKAIPAVPTSQKSTSNTDDTSIKNKAIIAAAAAAVINSRKSAGINEKETDVLNRDIPSDVNTLAVGNGSFERESGDIMSSDNNNTNNAVQEYGNVAPAEKMYTKSETDALIATAVALALKNAGTLKLNESDESSLEENKLNDYTTSLHSKDSAIVTHTSDVSGALRKEDDDEQQEDDENYGNVLVHSPREEDTITSLPFDEIASRHRDRFVLPNIDSSHVDFFENLKSQHTEKERPELTMGPSLIFAQEPEEPEEREITAADVPQRPANPPPHELLSKAGLSSTFTESRSMSPSSLRSKGKGPLEYSDLESNSARSNDDLRRTAVLHQQNMDTKRGSVDASSVSTSNTNEQLRSLNSSQYDAVTRSTGATDPTMINLITQTMIGDWLYKYTRRAVGGGLSEKYHKRYFWIHPYTRTLYWSVTAPGVNGNESKAKSALIENITSVPNYTSSEGMPNLSLLIQTSHRQIKLTAPTMEKHEIWLEAITHLLARDRSGKGLTLLNDSTKKAAENPNNRSVSSGTSGSLLNRPSFHRLHDIFQQPSSVQSMSTTDDHIDLEYDDDEALEDVRMCCNGKHHVSKLEKDHTHRQHYRKRKSRAT